MTISRPFLFGWDEGEHSSLLAAHLQNLLQSITILFFSQIPLQKILFYGMINMYSRHTAVGCFFVRKDKENSDFSHFVHND